LASERRRKRFDPGGALPPPPVPEEGDDEPPPSLEDQFSRLERARRTIEATLWYLEIEAPKAPSFRQGLLGRRLVIGRDPSCNLPLRGAGVSRQHAVLEHDEERDCWRISDAGSHNGTYVNGRRIREPTLLGPADTVHVGDWRMRLRADANDDRRDLLRFATLRNAAPLPGFGGPAPEGKPDRLVVVAGPAPRKEIRLDEGPVRLGPVKGSSLVPEGDTLADVDVEVTPLPEPSAYELVVRGEGGAVFVNDMPVRQRRLAPGDRLRLGRGARAVSLEFRPSEPGARPRDASPGDGTHDVAPPSESTPTETADIDFTAIARALARADTATAERLGLRASPDAPPSPGEAGAPAPARAGHVSGGRPPRTASPRADETPKPLTPHSVSSAPARRRTAGVVVALGALVALALSAAASLRSRRHDERTAREPGPPAHAVSQTSTLEPPPAPSAPPADASPPTSSSGEAAAAPPDPSAHGAPRPTAPPGRKPRTPAGGNAGKDADARMRDILCQQRGTCD
jgi:pSer/pThr/pTyr-binding forkhead associated (FHA) protein